MSLQRPIEMLVDRGRAQGKPASPDGLADLVEQILSSRLGSDHPITLVHIHYLVCSSPVYKSASLRQVRGAIEDLRVRGMLICNDLAGQGYYRARDMKEYQAFREVYMAYAKTILARVRTMDEEAEKRFGSGQLQEPLL